MKIRSMKKWFVALCLLLLIGAIVSAQESPYRWHIAYVPPVPCGDFACAEQVVILNPQTGETTELDIGRLDPTTLQPAPTLPVFLLGVYDDAGASYDVIATDGSERYTLLDAFYRSVWSPDSSQIIYFRPFGADFNFMTYVIDADGESEPRVVSGPLLLDGWLAWSPDGSQIVFTVRDNPGETDTSEIYVINAAGGDVRRLTNNDVPDVIPQWSPDGTRLLLLTDDDTPPRIDQIAIMNADGTDRTVLLNGLNPRWLSDTQFLYVTDQGLVPDPRFADFHIYDLETGESEMLFHVDGNAGQIRVTPDYSQFLYVTNRNAGLADVCVYNLETRDQQCFAIMIHPVSSPQWVLVEE